VIVNIVSQIPAAIWQRELPTDVEHEYVHTGEPVNADIHVVYGLRSRVEIPNSLSKTFFVASEPPEIREYNLNILRRYRRVLAPTFPYLSDLPNYVKVSAIAPWWVGTHAGGREHYDKQAVNVSLTREQLSSPSNPGRDVLSVIVSSKARTPLQQQRLRLVDYLERKMTHIDVWGEGRRFAADKADVLGTSRYHLAIENSQHPGYWTEKLSDPILMSNFLFYQGDPHVGATFDATAIEQIDCFDMDGSYRRISDIMAANAWVSSLESRESNRRALLERHSFHRMLEQIIRDESFEKTGTSRTVVPPQHPAPRWRRVINPLYRIVRAALRK
jgi:hypothetical protein